MTSAVYRGCRSATQSVVRKKKYIYIYYKTSCIARKSVFGVSDQVRHTSGCVARLEISGLERKDYTIDRIENKALISCAVFINASFVMALLQMTGYRNKTSCYDSWSY